MPHASNAVSPASLTLIQLIVDAIGYRDGECRRRQFAGLPVPTVSISRARLMIAATPCDPPMFDDTLRRAAGRVTSDIMLVRHGLRPELLDPVSIDLVAMRSGRRTLTLALMLYLDEWGGLWLVPGATSSSPFVRVGPGGLRWTTQPPFGHPDERQAGLMRAARAIILRHRA